MRKALLISLLLVSLTSVSNADLSLTVNGLDVSSPLEIEPNVAIVIAVSGIADDVNESYSVTCEQGGKLTFLPGPNSTAEESGEDNYLFTCEDEELALPIVNLTVAGKLEYQLVFFIIPDANTVIFGMDSNMYEAPEPESKMRCGPTGNKVSNTGSPMPENISGTEPEGIMALMASGYDIVLSGVNEYTTPLSYSNQSILITEDGFASYDKVHFEDCTVDVNGFMEFNSDVNLVNSTINVLGCLRAKAGIVITEMGASSIIARGDSLNTGRLTLEGKFANPIKLNSDYAATDTEFIIIESESSSNSTIKWVDFFGGWTNIQIYNKRLIDGISNCRFFASDYAIYQDGIDELTDVRFCFFYWNTISIYIGIDDCSTNEVEFLLDNVVIDSNYENPSYGIVFSGYQSIPDYSTLRILNSIITNSYCGWFIDGSSFYPPIMSNLAYYDNYYNDNLSSSEFQKNPMYLSQSPFVTPSDSNEWPYFIDPNSEVADVNIGDLWQSAPQQLLTSIYEDSTPRSNKGIGFGIPISLDYATKTGELVCDIILDGIVNYKDFAEFAGDWGFSGISVADFDEDGVVNVNDLDILSKNWLNNSYIEPNVIDNGDCLTLTCSRINDVNLSEFAIFLDGEYIATRNIINSPELLIDKMKSPNGAHNIKAVIKGNNSKPYVTTSKVTSFDIPLNGINFQELFDPCDYFVLQGDVTDGYIADINIMDFDKNILWSEQFSDDFTCLIDPNIFSDEINYTVTYSTNGISGYGSALALGGKPTNRTTGLILCMVPDGWAAGGNEDDAGTCRWAQRKMRQRNIATIVLLGFGENNQVTYQWISKVRRKYPNIRYLHINSHGHHECDGAGIFGFDTPRTIVQFNDGIWPSYNSRRWTDLGQQVPEDYDYLSDNLEKANTFAHLGFHNDQIRLLVIESCYGLRNVATMNAEHLIEYIDDAYEYEHDHYLNAHPSYPFSDVVLVFNMFSENQVAIGGASPIIKGIYPAYSRFFNYLYTYMADGMNFRDAYNYLVGTTSSQTVLREHRVRGLGLSALSNITLNSNP